MPNINKQAMSGYATGAVEPVNPINNPQSTSGQETPAVADAIPPRRILSRKWYLYLTEFFSGMAVMAVELGASRLLAPYFSSSQIVWTIIIGTIMIAMALGNVYGGRKADKNPNPDKLYLRILIAGIWIALIPVLGKYVIIGIAGLVVFTVSSAYLVVAGFISCLVLFVYPLFLLGTVTPSLVKYTTDSLEDNGKIVGQLGAANTIGSIIGTFIPTFVSIPAVGTSITFLIFAGILLLLAAIYFISEKARLKTLAAATAIFVAACIFGHSASFAFWEKGLTYEGESIYNYLQVKDDSESTILSTNVLFGVQSVKMKTQSLTGMYYDVAMAAPFMAGVHDKKDMNILILGNGTGTFATQCEKYFPNTRLHIDAVEIDSKITKLARQYFDLSPKVNVTTYDGRAYLNTVKKSYDVIMVDAYQDITIPFQMSSTEFFQLVKDHLTPDGVMVVNMNMRSDEEGNINQYLSDTIGTAFSHIVTADVSGTTNRELFASNNPAFLTRFEENVEKEQDPDLSYMMSMVSMYLYPYSPGNHILTDDKAPVELLGMRELDSIITDEVQYYKDLYKAEGISGLLKEL